MATIETVKQTCDRKINQQLMGLPFFIIAKKNIFRVKVAKNLDIGTARRPRNMKDN